MVTIALLAALVVPQPAPQGPGAADTRRAAVASALRHAAQDPQPIPLEPRSAKRGVLYDEARLLAVAARAALNAGTPLTSEQLMRLDVPRLLVVAHAVGCGETSVTPLRIDLRGGPRQLEPATPTPLDAAALARLLPGVALPPGAIATAFDRHAGPGHTVSVQYADPACEEDAARIPLRVTPPRKLRNVTPAWPLGVLGTPASGDVLARMRATIETDGAPADVQMLSGPSEFNLSAAAALRQWRYEPMRINGVPVPMVMTVTVSFSRR